jgi:hypothetical protein
MGAGEALSTLSMRCHKIEVGPKEAAAQTG